jgi:hypothetical protein
MSGILEKLLGPRAPAEQLTQDRLRYLLPTIFLASAAFCLLVSIFIPYWRMRLLAPQYPGGLEVQVYLNQMTGDVREIDGLNHYIGMRPLGEAAQLERSLSLIAIAVLSLLIVSAIFIHTRWAALLALPALLFPPIFLADLAFWMRNFGQNLDPRAPLSTSIKPFVPPLLGEGVVGQFRTVAAVDRGFYLAVFAAVLIVVGLYYHRRAYKPLVEAATQPTEEA